jgi:hypothetical protein
VKTLYQNLSAYSTEFLKRLRKYKSLLRYKLFLEGKVDIQLIKILPRIEQPNCGRHKYMRCPLVYCCSKHSFTSALNSTFTVTCRFGIAGSIFVLVVFLLDFNVFHCFNFYYICVPLCVYASVKFPPWVDEWAGPTVFCITWLKSIA